MKGFLSIFRIAANCWFVSVALWCKAAGDGLPPASYSIQNWGLQDGLPERSVLALAQTRDGYLWAGTWHGLARFDGVRFRSFVPESTPGMTSDLIMCLWEDREGALWAGSEGAIIRFENGRFRTFGRDAGVPQEVVTHIVQDGQGRLWASTGKWLGRREGESFRAYPVPHRIIRLVRGAGGELWASTGSGLYRWRNDALELIPETASLDLGEVAVNNSGKAWLVTHAGKVVAFQGGGLAPEHALDNYKVLALCAANNGDLWAGTNSKLLVRLRDGKILEVDRAEGLSGLVFGAILEDSTGNIWGGAEIGGLFRLREGLVRKLTRKEGVPVEDLSVLAATSNRVFMGTFQQSVFQWDGSQVMRMSFSQKFGPEVTGIALDGAGRMILGTFGYTFRATFDGQTERLPDSPAYTGRSFMLDRRGGLWLSNQDGVEHHPAQGPVRRYSRRDGLPDEKVSQLAEDRTGAIWGGTAKGMFRISDRQIKTFELDSGLPVPAIRAVLVDSEDHVWAGTLNGGLCVWRRDQERFITLNTEHGLPDNTIQQIVEDARGDLWLGTDRGLTRLSRQDLKEFAAGKRSRIQGMVLAAEEGLPLPSCGTGHQPSAIRAPDGRLWFCTASGLTIVNPAQIQRRTATPNVFIETVTVDGRQTEFYLGRAIGESKPVARSEIVVPAGAGEIAIQYTGLDLATPSRVRFRTRLHGRDSAWREMGTRREEIIHYLPPGRYEFEVIACNGDGVWNKQPAGVALVILPHFWQTAWFKGAIGLCIAGAVWGGHRYRMRRVERSRAVQENFSRQLIERQEVERKRVAGELHDSLGQNLLVVKNLALMAASTQPRGSANTRQFTEISEAAGLALGEMRAISRSLRPPELDRLGLTESIKVMLSRVGDAHPIQIKSTIELVDGLLPPEFEINLYRVIQEAMNNVVKHSQAAATKISLRREEETVRLKIEDNGKGFERGPAPVSLNGTGFGLTGMEERARLMGGFLKLFSAPGTGTRVILEIPVSNKSKPPASDSRTGSNLQV